jgi:hypothetical protein
MKTARAVFAAALFAGAVTASARAHDHLYVPAGVMVETPEVYRCVVGPVYNFYDGAWYGGQVPAVYRGYVYRPYYRYAAYRVFPRTYPCYLGTDGRWHRG